MKNIRILFIVIFILFSLQYSFPQAITNTNKPWTYWWWMGSAVNKADLKKQLNDFSSAGIGGVHIVPIYGAKGYENQFIPFLSENWLEMVQYTIEEANELNFKQTAGNFDILHLAMHTIIDDGLTSVIPITLHSFKMQSTQGMSC